ncbi:MAG TPA: methyltransferase, partial [Rhizorhapis sp.]|nr:methyltransferase [Rhizorhapis sp.]
VNGSAADVRRIIAEHGFEHADYILSGLPFSTLPRGVGPAIARETEAALRPGGAFLVYQYSPKVRKFIAPHFSEIDEGFELWNIPPCQLYWAWKDAPAEELAA